MAMNAKPMFRGLVTSLNMCAMLAHKPSTFAQPRMLLWFLYEACNDDMIVARKVQGWREWAILRQPGRVVGDMA
jgi:hypothetical protein